MKGERLIEVLHHLRRVSTRREGPVLGDGQLLESFVSRRDAAAVEALIMRHGPMVWGVCRRVLGNDHDAEDAFQATFLVLIRRAASVTSKEYIANWLYGVARQTALKARAMLVKRKGRERQVEAMPDPLAVERENGSDLQAVLDEELGRLPSKYRVIVVLCDVKGIARKEAARQLGCPEGTVAGRLARARTLLARRLAQRGVTLPAGMALATTIQNTVSAQMPTAIVSSTIKAAGQYATGHAVSGGISVDVVALTEGVLKAMWMSKMKASLGVFLACGLLAVLVLGEPFRQPTQAQQPQEQPFQVPLAREIAHSATGGRYQMVVRDSTVFVFDSTTGQCWYRDTRPEVKKWIDMGTPVVTPTK